MKRVFALLLVGLFTFGTPSGPIKSGSAYATPFECPVGMCWNEDTQLCDIATEEGCEGGGGKVRETLTEMKLFVTEIKGQAAIDAGITLLSLVTGNFSAEVLAAIEMSLMDAYMIICYDGGTTYCTELDWTICASGGCPPAGLIGN